MSLQTDIAGDYAQIDATETVTLTPKNRTASADTSVTALRQPLNKQQIAWAASIGQCLVSVSFVLFGNTMGTLVPQPLDQITDSGNVVYVIRQVDKLTLGSRYRCSCGPNE